MRTFIYSLFFSIIPLLALSQEVNYNFEDGNISVWTQAPDGRWEVSSSNPLGGTLSLKHSPTSGADTDRISIELPAGWNGNEGSIVWQFRVRHRFNPSSTNHWGIFLSCDQNATGMISTSNPNGYAVGVNLSGSTDDLLKLYKIVNGVFTPIITSALNWETQIGSSLTSIGAIEVRRMPNGTFELKASATGSFSNITLLGSVTDNSYSFGGYFGIYYKYTTSAAGLIMVDDVKLTLKPINQNNHDALVVPPSTQIPSGTISSLATTPEQAVNLFRFRISDTGTSDGLPTYPRKLVFKKVAGADAAEWVTAIGGVKLTNALGHNIPILSTTILPETIELLTDKNAMPVADGAVEDFTLGLYLKPGSISNGATFQIKVNSTNHGWEADLLGSEFSEEFTSEVVSNILTVEVIATKVYFQTYPTTVVVNSPFTVSAYAGDSQGNMATSYTSLMELLKEQGGGEISFAGGSIVSASNGVATWTGVSYSGRDVFSLRALGQGLTSAVGNSITVSNDASSLVVNPTQQVSSTAIPSTSTSPGQAVEMMRFTISDPGTNDGVPTHVRQISLKRPTGDNLASYTRNIGGIIIQRGSEIIPAGNPNILTSTITIPLESGALTIADGEDAELSLWVYLKSTGLEDGKNLSFSIDWQSHGFTADPSGSQFSTTFPSPIISNSFTISVVATRLAFTTVPTSVGIDEPFSVTVSAVDEAGNPDIHATGNATLSKNTGNGWLTVPSNPQSLQDGVATWNNLKYFTAEAFTLLALSSTLNDGVSSLIYCSDRTSTILAPAVTLQPGVISSLNVEPENAVEVLRFRISDPGTTDGLPTFVTQLAFRSFGLANSMPLNKVIKGVTLRVNGMLKTISSTTIVGDLLTLTFSPNEIIINDLSAADVSLAVFLNKGGIENGSTIRLYVPAASHGWQFAANGSGFATAFSTTVYGPTFTIEVLPTTIKFTSQPFGITTAPSTFALEASATDAYGNVATAANGSATLGLVYGAGALQVQEATIPFSNGIAKWELLSVNAVGKYKFRASAIFDQSATGISEEIWCGMSAGCQYNENFDLEYPFPSTSVWGASSVSPIAGAMSLKHMLTGVAGESQLSIPLAISDIGRGPREWSFVIRNGNWDPSSDNAFWFVLTSDSISLKSGDYNGYAVGVNLSGTTDRLSLWKMTRGKSAQLLIESSFDWDEKETVLIRVTRTPSGEWSLWFQAEFGLSETRLGGKAIDTQHSSSKACGLVFKFTSTRAGELWLDNLSICSTTFPPIISNVRTKSLTSVEITFTKALSTTSASLVSNFSIKRLTGESVNIIESLPNPENSKMVTLRTDQLPFETLRLIVNGVQDTEGYTVNDSIQFGIGTFGAFGNVVINEVMAKPDPAIELPAVEYIELFNRTQNPINLKGWKLKGNNTTVTIPERTIEAGGFVLLCSTGSVNALNPYGGVAVGVTSFPSLLNAGMTLRLYDSDVKLMSWVDYSETWYGSDIKKAGGYSLERIDPNNLVEGKRNWIGSNDPTGGTPGRANSAIALNPDVYSPWVVEVKALTPTSVSIAFSETMDSLQVTLPTNYSISNGIGNPIWAVSEGPYYSRVTLTLSNALTAGEVYELCFGSQIIDFSGNALGNNCKPLALHQTPANMDIVINEVLFNPYTGGTDFVELYNRSNKIVDLYLIKIANRNRTTLELNEVYTASDTTRMLLPNSYAVLSVNPTLVKRFYTVENESAMVWTKKMPSYPNDNGTVVIMNENNLSLDEFAYNEKMHLSLITDRKGVSLERINPNLPTNNSSSWQSAAQTAGFATPSARNSQFQEPGETEDAFELAEKIFSPDGDGYNDVLLINYILPEDGYTANIVVFDSQGRRIRRLASNLTLSTSGTIKWDGVTDSNRKAALGAYVVFIEVFTTKNNVKDNVKQYKKTCVVATRFGN
jgi:hypothetical protein